MLPENISEVLNAVQKPVISSKGLRFCNLYCHSIIHARQLMLLLNLFPHETFDFLVENFYC